MKEPITASNLGGWRPMLWTLRYLDLSHACNWANKNFKWPHKSSSSSPSPLSLSCTQGVKWPYQFQICTLCTSVYMNIKVIQIHPAAIHLLQTLPALVVASIAHPVSWEAHKDLAVSFLLNSSGLPVLSQHPLSPCFLAVFPHALCQKCVYP